MRKPANNRFEQLGYRYWAFISYSKRNKPWAQWVHRAIETYEIPAQLMAHATPTGEPAPERFHPLFYDRDELPASSDLGAEIEHALHASRYLIVVCSRRAAQSRWVDKEIKTFHSFGRHQRVLAIIVDGEPNTGDERECFPPALRAYEPIAADVRPEGDGKNNAKLKLLAGMLGVSLDALKQRDARRKIRQLQIVVAVSVLLAIGLGGLAWYANHQRAKAVKTRQQAEAILEFLLYDLRDKLEPVRRLDIVREVDARVDRYYEELGLEDGDASLLAHRARAYLNEGDRLFKEGKLPLSIEADRKSLQLAERLGTADPSNTRWQEFLSECYDQIGTALLAQGDLAGSLDAHRESLAIRQSLAKAEPSNMSWIQEIAVSDNYVGDVMLARGDLAEALRSYRDGLAIRQRLANADPNFAYAQEELVDSLCAVGGVLERQLDPEATKCWRHVFDVLSQMKRNGIAMSPKYEQILHSLRNIEVSDSTTSSELESLPEKDTK